MLEELIRRLRMKALREEVSQTLIKSNESSIQVLMLIRITIKAIWLAAEAGIHLP
jgi:hypothetical protein